MDTDNEVEEDEGDMCQLGKQKKFLCLDNGGE